MYVALSRRTNDKPSHCSGESVSSRLLFFFSFLQKIFTMLFKEFVVLVIFVSVGIVAGDAKYSRAVVESCKGCQLNRLPDVKKFIFEDLPHYENTEFKHIQGEPPELVLYDQHEEEVERIKLSALTRDECNELLSSKGFKRSSSPPIKDEI